MFGLTQDELRAEAARTGFARNTLEKALRMLDILAQLKSRPSLMGVFALKGGTALNLFLLDMPRLSVDLDFNYIGALAAADMRRDRQRIAAEIQDTFAQEYHVDLTKDPHALAQFSLAYTTLARSSDSLRIEINYLLRHPILPPSLRRCGLDRGLEFLCLGLEELVAGKIVALLARYTARDLFDVYQIAGAPLTMDRGLLRSLVIFFSLLSRFSVFKLFEPDFARVGRERIRNDLVPMLKIGEYPDRATLVRAAENFLAPLTALSQKEAEAIREFYASGKLDLDALIPQKEIHGQLSASPALAWKIQNIRKRL